jgi:thiamine-monophosphate kinase
MSGESDTLVGEDAIIALLRPLAGPGGLGFTDDCATLTPRPGTDLVLKTDPVAEGVHFLPGDAPEDIGWKALAVNVSDLAAKGARPLGYLMALSFPLAPTRAWMTRFAAGLGEAQAAFGCALLGGDTDRRPGPITISITVLGEVESGSMVRRAAARPGDLLFVSGSIGDAALGLRLCQAPDLAARWGLTPTQAATLVARYRRPQPRLALGPALRAHAAASMDLSDGLVKDAGRMLRASGVSGQLQLTRVPLSQEASQVVSADAALLPQLAAAGDDYEILAAIHPDAADAFAAEARMAGLTVTCVGHVDPGEAGALRILDASGSDVQMQSGGWDHF